MHSPRQFQVVAALLGIAMSTQALGAQQDSVRLATSHSVTLSQAIALALRQNPDVLIAQAMVDSARSEQRIARALPNPTLSGNPNSPYQYAASIPIDITPARRYRTRAASLGVDASESDRRDAIRQLSFIVSRTFFDVLLARAKRSHASDRYDAMHQLLVADSVRLKSGDVPLSNLVRSELEMAHAEADVARAEVDLQSAQGSLRALLGFAHSDSAFTVVGSLDYKALEPSGDQLVTLAMSQRPDRFATQLRVEQSRVGERNASSLLLPTPVLSFVRQNTAPFDNGHFYSFGLSFELPSLNLFGGQRSRAAAGSDAARLMQRRVELRLDRDVTSALAEFHIQRGLVERLRGGLLTRIDESVGAVQYAYRRGAVSLLAVLDAVKSQQEARSDYDLALHDYWVSVYALNAAVGSDVFGVNR